jgi:hypothetical protein
MKIALVSKTSLMSLNMVCVHKERDIQVGRMRRVTSPADRWTP